MKTIHISKTTHFAIISLIFYLLMPQLAHAQINILNRAKQKLEERVGKAVDKKVEETVEKKIEEAEKNAQNRQLSSTLSPDSSGISINVKMEDCDCMKSYQTGTISETVFYDKNNKISSIISNKVLERKDSASGWVMRMEATTKNSKETVSIKALATSCINGVFKADANMNINITDLPPDFKMTGSSTGEAPSYLNLEVGKILPDAEVTISSGMEGVTLMKATAKWYNRKVLSLESVTTPAGTFECYKISYDMDIKILFRLIKTNVIEYWNKDYGIIKSTSYDSKGKEQGHSELTKFQ